MNTTSGDVHRCTNALSNRLYCTHDKSDNREGVAARVLWNIEDMQVHMQAQMLVADDRTRSTPSMHDDYGWK